MQPSRVKSMAFFLFPSKQEKPVGMCKQIERNQRKGENKDTEGKVLEVRGEWAHGQKEIWKG